MRISAINPQWAPLTTNSRTDPFIDITIWTKTTTVTIIEEKRIISETFIINWYSPNKINWKHDTLISFKFRIILKNESDLSYF